ncbi:copper resistance D family protein [Prauserella muralis]|uniref:Copper resistance protein CopD n=1 Tax=Prauserella muralis TaxID=588067 RepID=A0A2V4BCI1_9PSEU|nr:CopD family protein [Prauserella muralis]PXY31759.1 copper resistance protein CopD [Prauserella muralis]TWE13849.1 putative copper resistance protein D [Prauserella muralis]
MTRAGATSPVPIGPLVSVATAALAGVLLGLALGATAPVSGVTDAGEVVSVAIPVTRVVLDLAAATAIGLALLPVLTGYDRPRLSEPVLARGRPVAVAAALVWAVAALVSLVLQAAEYRPGSGTVSFADLGEYVRTVAAGKALLIVAALALTLAALNVLAVRRGERVPAEVRAGLGLFTLLPLPVTGHAGTWSFSDLTMVSIELHVLAAVAWTGGLGAMVVLLAANRTLLAHALPRFSRLATVSVLLTAATGLFNALVQLAIDPATDVWTSLFGTPYGRLVLGKLACLAAIGALGAYLRWRLLPRIVRHERTALVQWATLELTAMALAFGIAAVLSRAPAA